MSSGAGGWVNGIMLLMCGFVTILAAALPVLDFATNSIARRIESCDPAVCLARFADYPPSKGKLGFPRCLFENPFPANPHFYLRDVDFSCASPWNDSTGTLRAGTLISKRHIIFAKHFSLWKGVRILFVGDDGGVCPCNVEATMGLDHCDIMIASLNAEVTPNVHPAKILPADYRKYLGDGKGLPCVTLNQNECALLTEMRSIVTHGFGLTTMSFEPSDAHRRRFRRPIVVGDSGSPAFLLIGNELILLHCCHHGGCGSGPAVHLYAKEIQKAMDELCPGYKLESFDFENLKKE